MNAHLCAHCSCSQRYLSTFILQFFQLFSATLHDFIISAEFLSKCYRQSILNTGSSDFHHILIFLHLCCKYSFHILNRSNQLFKVIIAGNLHSRRNHIIGGLPHIYMGIGMYGCVALFSCQYLICPVCNYLIQIHICRGPSSALDNINRILTNQPSLNHIIRRPADCLAHLFCQSPAVSVCQSCRLFYFCNCGHKFRIVFFSPPRHHKIFSCSFCLNSVIYLRRNFLCSDTVLLHSHFHFYFPFLCIILYC